MTGGIGRYLRKSKGHIHDILDILGKLDALGVLGTLPRAPRPPRIWSDIPGILDEVRVWPWPCGRVFPKGIEKRAFSSAIDGHADEDWTHRYSS